MRRVLLLFAAFSFVGCGSTAHTSGNVASHVAGSSPSSASDATPTPPPDPGPDLNAVGRSAARAIKLYYTSLAEKDYEAAWTRVSETWQSTLGGFRSWEDGYATTTSISVSSATASASDLSHARVRVRLDSVDHDACGRDVDQRFAGELSLRRFNGRWQITGSDITKTGGGSVRRDVSSCAAAKPKAHRNAATAHGDARTGSSTSESTKVCYPGFDVPAVDVPAVTVPALDVPPATINGHHYPGHHYPAHTYPGDHYPGHHYAGHCYGAAAAFSPTKTSVLEAGYDRVDDDYSSALTSRYWSSSGRAASYPDPTANGFGEFNGAGFPKNQYVRPYVRRDGTMVSGYWRNSPTDGLPTCRIISC